MFSLIPNSSYPSKISNTFYFPFLIVLISKSVKFLSFKAYSTYISPYKGKYICIGSIPNSVYFYKNISSIYLANILLPFPAFPNITKISFLS